MLFWIILIVSLCLLSISLLNLGRAAYPPSVRISRVWRVQGDSILDLTGVQDVYIDLSTTIFENALVNYNEIVVSGSGSPSVKAAWFARSVPPDSPYIVFHTEIDATDHDEEVNYDFVLPHVFDVSEQSTMVLYVHTNTNATRIEIDGLNVNGTSISMGMSFESAFQRYFLYVVPLREHGFYAIDQLSIVCYCPAGSNVNDYTVVKLVNILDDFPSVDGVTIQQGQSGVLLNGVAFAHSFDWIGLKPQNVSFSTTYWLSVSWSSTMSTIEYSFESPIKEMDGLSEVYLDMFFYRRADAPLVEAKVALDDTQQQLLDIKGNVTEAVLNQPNDEWPRFLTSLSPEIRWMVINVAFMFWPSPWQEIAVSSFAILLADVFVFAFIEAKARFLKPVNKIGEAENPDQEQNITHIIVDYLCY